MITQAIKRRRDHWKFYVLGIVSLVLEKPVFSPVLAQSCATDRTAMRWK